jgi:hypothetical protein
MMNVWQSINMYTYLFWFKYYIVYTCIKILNCFPFVCTLVYLCVSKINLKKINKHTKIFK